MSRRDHKSAHRRDVSREGNLEFPRREIPDLDDSIAASGCKPLVARFKGQGTDPAQVAREDFSEFPRGMPFRFDGLVVFAADELLSGCSCLGGLWWSLRGHADCQRCTRFAPSASVRIGSQNGGGWSRPLRTIDVLDELCLDGGL